MSGTPRPPGCVGLPRAASSAPPSRAAGGDGIRFNSAYLYLLPAGLLIGFVFGYPTIQSIASSVQRNKGINDTGRFIGIDNFVQFSRDPIFWQVTWQTFVWTVGVVLFTTILAYTPRADPQPALPGQGHLPDDRHPARRDVARLMAMVFRFAFDPNGLVNHTLSGFGPTDGGIPWLANNPQAMAAIIFVGILVSVPLTGVMIAAAMRIHPARALRGGRPSTARADWRRRCASRCR